MHSIHSTPVSLARYIVQELPLGEFGEKERFIVEPCCGHGTFLIAALNSLRELLPTDLSPEARHNYFTQMLSGYDISSFAIEVGRLSLMLADFPNHNGWKLFGPSTGGNVFDSTTFDQALNKASAVLCNPPFADFTGYDRKKYGLQSVHKPAELLHRVLDKLNPPGVLGFVLPQQIIDGSGYRDVRERLAKAL